MKGISCGSVMRYKSYGVAFFSLPTPNCIFIQHTSYQTNNKYQLHLKLQNTNKQNDFLFHQENNLYANLWPAFGIKRKRKHNSSYRKPIARQSYLAHDQFSLGLQHMQQLANLSMHLHLQHHAIVPTLSFTVELEKMVEFQLLRLLIVFVSDHCLRFILAHYIRNPSSAKMDQLPQKAPIQLCHNVQFFHQKLKPSYFPLENTQSQPTNLHPQNFHLPLLPFKPRGDVRDSLIWNSRTRGLLLLLLSFLSYGSLFGL